jgi:GNAT superfamily N-acetyltransferase
MVSFPAFPFRVRLLNGLVKYFPRRLVPAGACLELSKFVAHPTLLSRTLSDKDRFNLPAEFELKIASDQEVSQLACHAEGLPLDVYQKRLHEGDKCICLYHQNELVSYNWLAFVRAGIFLGLDKQINIMRLKANQVFTYDFYTYNAHRNRGYGKLLKSGIFQFALSERIHEVLTCVHADNAASLAVHIKQGYNLKSMVFCARIMDWTVSFLSTPIQTSRYQAWFDRYKEDQTRKARHEKH